MAKFEIEICAVFDYEFTFNGSEKNLWAWMKENWDSIGEFTVRKMRVYESMGIESCVKVWCGSMKNGRISKRLIIDLTKPTEVE